MLWFWSFNFNFGIAKLTAPLGVAASVVDGLTVGTKHRLLVFQSKLVVLQHKRYLKDICVHTCLVLVLLLLVLCYNLRLIRRQVPIEIV